MRTAVFQAIRCLTGYLKGTDECKLVASKQASINDEVDDYIADIKHLFLSKFRQDPCLRTTDPEKIWKSIEHTVRRDVENLLEKKASWAGSAGVIPVEQGA